MSVSTSVPQTARLGRSRRMVIVVVLAAVIGLIAWAIATYAPGPGSRPATAARRRTHRCCLDSRHSSASTCSASLR